MLASRPQSPRQEDALLLVKLDKLLVMLLLLAPPLPFCAFKNLPFSLPWRQICS
jgi:hypothetical protein